VDDTALSKRLAFVLRHRPSSVGLTLDEAGWVPVGTLLDALHDHGVPVTRERLEHLVGSSDKQRFALEDDRIRAQQGHSVPVDLGLPDVAPPARLFHGTPERTLGPVLAEGLHRAGRHAVHLSPDARTAHAVGSRRGRAVVLVVDAAAMHAGGHAFQHTANDVWLTAHVPPEHLRRL
jgi:putative RNA 2'-phosphotransferase